MDNNKRLKLVHKLSTNLRCSRDLLSRLSTEQLGYINSRAAKSTFLEACPGSGKTEVIGLKAAYEITKWNKANGGIAVVTFTKSAAKELSDRIRKFSDLSTGLFPHFVGTFDSWLHGYIFQPFCHYRTGFKGKEGDNSIRLIEDDSSAAFLSSFQTMIPKNGNARPVRATEYSVVGNDIIPLTDNAKGLITAALTNFQKESLREKKLAFVRAGFATYSDAELLSLSILSRYGFLAAKIAQRFPVILIDECQDLSENQINLINKLKNAGASIHLIGDLNQSIYEFRRVDPTLIQTYINNNQFDKLKLTNNYRSCQEIVNLTNAVLGANNNIQSNVETTIANPCIHWQYTDANFNELPAKFEQLVKGFGLPISDCAIVARGKSTLQNIRPHNDKVAHSDKVQSFAMGLLSWHRQSRTTQDVKNALFYVGRSLCMLGYNGNGDPRNEYCPYGIQHTTWRIILKRFLNAAVGLFPFELDGVPLNWTTWSSNLKAFLELFWNNLPGEVAEYNTVRARVRAPRGKGAQLVNALTSVNHVHNLFHTTTIHGVKGQTYEAVMLISSRTAHGDGGHASHWLRIAPIDQEHIRFAYVAVSRPRKLLVIATPALNAQYQNALNALGFVTTP